MAKPVILAIVLLVGLTYAAFFLMWNSETKVNVVTLRLVGDPFWVEGVLMGVLPIIGALIGALAMAIALWGPWASQRAAAQAAEAKLQKAISRFNEQKQLLSARTEELAELRARVEELEAVAQQPTVGGSPANPSSEAAGPAEVSDEDAEIT